MDTKCTFGFYWFGLGWIAEEVFGAEHLFWTFNFPLFLLVALFVGVMIIASDWSKRGVIKWIVTSMIIGIVWYDIVCRVEYDYSIITWGNVLLFSGVVTYWGLIALFTFSTTREMAADESGSSVSPLRFGISCLVFALIVFVPFFGWLPSMLGN